MKRLFLTSPIFAVLAVLGAFPVAFASHSRPFNGTLTGSFTNTSSTTAAIIGTGHVQHLGKTVSAGVGTITGRAECGGLEETEEHVFTAANGDQVFLSTTDTICPTSDPRVFRLTWPFTIT